MDKISWILEIQTKSRHLTHFMPSIRPPSRRKLYCFAPSYLMLRLIVCYTFIFNNDSRASFIAVCDAILCFANFNSFLSIFFLHIISLHIFSLNLHRLMYELLSNEFIQICLRYCNFVHWQLEMVCNISPLILVLFLFVSLIVIIY